MTRPSLSLIAGGRDAASRAGRPSDVSPRALRAAFVDAWADLLAEVYGPAPLSRTAEIAVDFGVTERAARDWVGGVSGPRGAGVVIALLRFPEAAARHLLRGAALRRAA